MEQATKELNNQVHYGLEGVVAGDTAISKVDGKVGKLLIRGIPLEDFAPVYRFEEAASLVLWDQASWLRPEELAVARCLPKETLRLLEAAAEKKVSAMDGLRMGISTLVPTGQDVEDIRSLISKAASIAGTFLALSEGRVVPSAAFEEEGHAAFFLHLLQGKRPTNAEVRALETYWNTVMDHGFNNSTFTARMVVSTGSDLVSAVTAAIGSLKGPLHGGAPGPALQLIEEVQERGDAEGVIRERLERGERLMGFGHRQYKVRDPRAEVLQRAVGLLAEGRRDPLYETSVEVERIAVRLLEEFKPGRGLHANVEFYTSLLLRQLNIPSYGFSAVFACSRVVGWLGHALEQRSAGRLIRPDCRYVGREG